VPVQIQLYGMGAILVVLIALIVWRTAAL
jgi:hypothetical protein